MPEMIDFFNPADMPTMTGEEQYPVIGKQDDEYVNRITRHFEGLPRYAGCVEKNKLAHCYFGGLLILGEIAVLSAKNGGVFRHAFNPPLELHCWVSLGGGKVADFALPGVIERGMMLRDEIGPFIEGREPSILVGVPPEWVIYRGIQILTNS